MKRRKFLSLIGYAPAAAVVSVIPMPAVAAPLKIRLPAEYTVRAMTGIEVLARQREFVHAADAIMMRSQRILNVYKSKLVEQVIGRNALAEHLRPPVFAWWDMGKEPVIRE